MEEPCTVPCHEAGGAFFTWWRTGLTSSGRNQERRAAFIRRVPAPTLALGGGPLGAARGPGG